MKGLPIAIGLFFAGQFSGCGAKDAPLRGATFESSAWKAADSHSGVRAKMLGDFLDKVGVIGRTRKDIEADLGPPNHESWGKSMPYPGWVVGVYDPTGFDSGTGIGFVVQFDGNHRAVGFWTPFRQEGQFTRKVAR